MNHYLFIDAAYLHVGFRTQMQAVYGEVPEIDYLELANSHGASRTYFYDAIEYAQKTAESTEEHKARVGAAEDRNNYVSRLPTFHVREGHVRRGTTRPREQKAVDVMLAVEAMEHASRGTMAIATILSGDLDFEPLVAALVSAGIDTRVTYIRGQAAPELISAADRSREMTITDFHSFSAKAFRDNHMPVQITVGQTAANFAGFTVAKTGTVNGRPASLHRQDGSWLRVWVQPGSKWNEQGVTISHPDESVIDRAVGVIVGPVTWA